jgi:LCP family protein required for cell wall assembly
MSSPTYRSGNSSGRASVPSSHGAGRASAPSHDNYPPGPPPRGGNSYNGDPGRRPRWGRIGTVLGVGLLVLALVGVGGGYLYYRSLDSDLQRADAFSQVSGARPAAASTGAQNILLLGSDSRDPDNKAKPGEWRTDTMILMHTTGDGRKAVLISLPRDLYVSIPQSPTNPELGNTRSKINAAFAWGGLPLAVQTVEGLTGVHVDHTVLVDFGGFKEVTDALGGVDLTIDQSITSIHEPHRKFEKGVQHLNGEEALDWVRQRKQFAQGDFARMRHQQEFMKALMDKAASSGTLGNPFKLNAFLKSVTKSMTVDNDFSLASTAYTFRDIRSSDLTFMVSPNIGAQPVNGESVVVSDKEKASALYESVANDTVMDWLAKNGASAAKPGG